MHYRSNWKVGFKFGKNQDIVNRGKKPSVFSAFAKQD